MKHRTRNTLIKRLAGPTLGCMAIVGLPACQTMDGGGDDEPLLSEENVGQVVGGVAGAAAGSQVGSGSGQTVATVVGAVLGGMVGERIGARMGEEDRSQAGQALNQADVGETVRWENEEGTEFALTPERTYANDLGRTCRDFDYRVATDRGSDTGERTACRQSDGTWEIVS